MEPFVQRQFDDYQANRPEKDIISREELREIIIKDLSFVSKMVWQNTPYTRSIRKYI